MIQTEQTPFDLQNSRNIGIYLRKLSQSYGSLDVASWLQDAVPSFLFGILTVPLSPLWDGRSRSPDSGSGDEGRR